VGLREAVKPCLLAAEVDRPFKCLSIAALRIRLAKHTSEGVLFPSILLFTFLPAHNLLFSSAGPGHVSPPVLLVSAPPHSAATRARGAAPSSELLIWEIADN